MGEFLLEGLVHVLLQVKGLDVFDDRGLEGQRKETETVSPSDLCG